jgi:hypothetical protein
MNTIVDHAFQVAAQHRTAWAIRQIGRSVEVIHLRPEVGVARLSMDFSATGEYLERGYAYAARALAGGTRRRPVEHQPVAAAPAPAFQ